MPVDTSIMAGPYLRSVFYFRDDDIGELSDNLVKLIDLFAGYRLPLNLGVVPGLLTPHCRDFLRKKCRRTKLFEIHQHGFLHKNHSSSITEKSEYGQQRNRRAVLKELSEGKNILRKAFGNSFFEAFSPPWNRMDEAHIGCLKACGFKVLSRSADKGGRVIFYNKGICEISVTLDIFEWKDRGFIGKEAFFKKAAADLKIKGICGIVLHHRCMDAQSFDTLKVLLEKISKRSLRCLSFKEIYRHRKRQEGI